MAWWHPVIQFALSLLTAAMQQILFTTNVLKYKEDGVKATFYLLLLAELLFITVFSLDSIECAPRNRTSANRRNRARHTSSHALSLAPLDSSRFRARIHCAGRQHNRAILSAGLHKRDVRPRTPRGVALGAHCDGRLSLSSRGDRLGVVQVPQAHPKGRGGVQGHCAGRRHAAWYVVSMRAMVSKCC